MSAVRRSRAVRRSQTAATEPGGALRTLPLRRRAQDFLQAAPHDLLLSDLERPADLVFVWIIVHQSRFDQVFASQQEPRALRSPQSLAATEVDEIEPHFVVVAQVRNRRDVGSGAVEGGDTVAL